MEIPGFCPPDTRRKWNVFWNILRKEESTITEGQLWEFLRHFSILAYDLEKEESVVLSLLYSHLAQYGEDPQSVWAQLVSFVIRQNKDAGTVTRDRLPPELLEKFKSRQIETPLDLPRWESSEFAGDLALACLVGQWDEQNMADMEALRELIPNCETWTQKLCRLVSEPNSPITLHEGIWKVRQRTQLWEKLGATLRLKISQFESIAIRILSEEVPYPGNSRHSAHLRYGLAMGVMLLGTHSNAECWPHGGAEDAEFAARKIVSSLLNETSSFQQWVSLNPVLSLLAEAAPDEFLTAVEGTLKRENSPMDEFFQSKSSGGIGHCNVTCLFWALELLAWDPLHLIRVCCILGQMIERAPGETGRNGPGNSLVSILLPWYPQTLADIEKRLAAERALTHEVPEAAWKVLPRLLYGQTTRIIVRNFKSYRLSIPEKVTVTSDDHRRQNQETANLLLSLIPNHPERLAKLAELLLSFSKEAFQTALKAFSEMVPKVESHDEKRKIWESLRLLTIRQRKLSDVQSATAAERLESLEALVQALIPSDPRERFQILFRQKDFVLFQSKDYEKERYLLEEQCQTAVHQILEADGLEGLLHFADSVERPWIIGGILGQTEDFDEALLPELLSSEKTSRRDFIASYIAWRHAAKGWEWLNTLHLSEWKPEQTCQFLQALPLCMKTWEVTEKLPDEQQEKYWKRKLFFHYLSSDEKFFALNKLIRFHSTYTALNLLTEMIQSEKDVQNLTPELCTSILLDEKAEIKLEPYSVANIIAWLQTQPNGTPEMMEKIESRYLDLLDDDPDFRPIFLERRLATDPKFFIDVICSLYKSKNRKFEDIAGNNRPSPSRSFTLLSQWTLVPGTDEKGVFHPESFHEWLDSVKELARKADCFCTAMDKIGEVLIHSPADDDGFWIHRTVAEILNEPENESILDGFEMGKRNELGVHDLSPIDPEEARLASHYAELADMTENAGFRHLAQKLRSLSKFFEFVAKQNIRWFQNRFIQND